jgi:hypothetical protein
MQLNQEPGAKILTLGVTPIFKPCFPENAVGRQSGLRACSGKYSLSHAPNPTRSLQQYFKRI